MKIGFVGAGNVAQAHFDAVVKNGATVEAICSRGDQCEEFAKKNNIKNAYHSVEEMMLGSELDGIYVLTQPSSYKEVLSIISPYKKPIFIEKPLGYTTEDSAAIEQFLKDAVYVGLNRRLYSNIQKIKTLLEKEEEYVAHLFFPERLKDFRMRDDLTRNNWPMLNTIHGVDLISYLVGWPTEILAKESWGDLDCATMKQHYLAMYRTDKGNRAILTTNYDSPGGWRIHIFLKEREVILSPFEKVSIKSMTGIEEIPFSEEDIWCKPGFYEQTRRFLAGIKDPSKRDQWISFDESYKSMKALERLMF